MDLMEVKPEDGNLRLKNLNLNVRFLNKIIVEHFPQVGIRVEKGCIGSLDVHINWNLLNDSITIQIDEVKMTLVNERCEFFDDMRGNTSKKERTSVPPTETKSADGVDDPYSIKQGLDILANWIEAITQKVKIMVGNLSIVFLEKSNSDGLANGIELHFAAINYFDETPDGIDRFALHSGSMTPGVAMTLHKCLVLRGFQAFIVQYSNSELLRKHSLLSSDSGDHSIKIILGSDTPAARDEAPSLDVDIFLQPFYINLDKFQLEVLFSLLSKVAKTGI